MSTHVIMNPMYLEPQRYDTSRPYTLYDKSILFDYYNIIQLISSTSQLY